MTVPCYTSHAPGLIGEMLEPVQAVQKDLILRAASLNAATSLAACALGWVRRLDGSKSPVCDMSFAFANSGAGKSTHLRHVLSPIEDVSTRLRRDMAEDQRRQDIKALIWKKKLNATERMIQRDYDGKDADIEVYEARLVTLYEKKPDAPLKPNFLYRDTTVQAALHGASQFPILALLDDEGGRTLDVLRPKDFHSLATLWDGGLLPHNRVHGGRMEVQAFFTMFLAVQNDVYIEFLARRGKLLKASGVSARTLYYWVAKDWATGDTIHADLDLHGDMHARYAARIDSLFDQAMANVRAGLDTIPAKELAPKAKGTAQALHRQYQEMMRDPAYVECVDFLAKKVDHVTRMAAKWHIFEGREGDISVEYVEAAAETLRYHLDVFRLLHAQPPRERMEASDADRLLTVVQEACRDRSPTRSELMNLALNAGISSSTRFSNALGLLGQEGKVEITRRGHVRLPPRGTSQPRAMPPRWEGRFD